MTPEEELKISEKKQKQHEAWMRWYNGPKGKAWRDSRRKRPEPVKSEPVT